MKTILIELTGETRDDDIPLPCDNEREAIIFVSQEAFRGFGYRLIEYDSYSGLDEFVLPDEPNAQIMLRYSGEDGGILEADFQTAAEVRSTIDALHDSDGYLVFASWDGDSGATRLEQRPRLWRVDDEMEGDENGIAFGRVIAQRPNEYGRTDQDRF